MRSSGTQKTTAVTLEGRRRRHGAILTQMFPMNAGKSVTYQLVVSFNGKSGRFKFLEIPNEMISTVVIDWLLFNKLEYLPLVCIYGSLPLLAEILGL